MSAITTTPNVWMHLGAGSFHRAHQAWYLHRLLQQQDERWSIALGNIRNDADALLAALQQQGGQYTLKPSLRKGYATMKPLPRFVKFYLTTRN